MRTKLAKDNYKNLNFILGLTLSLWARNLFNESHIYRRSNANRLVLGDYANFNAPRTLGIEATPALIQMLRQACFDSEFTLAYPHVDRSVHLLGHEVSSHFCWRPFQPHQLGYLVRVCLRSC